MAQSIREKGFRRTTVADVVRHARVSRRTFYEQFDDLVSCYLELADVTSDLVLDAIARAVEPDLPLRRRLERAIDAYLEMLAAEPALTRSYGLELHLAGERGIDVLQGIHQRAAQLLHDLIEAARTQEPELQPLTVDTAVVIVAGIRELITGALGDELTDQRLSEVRTVATDLFRAVLTAPRAS
jgi:AcrR family transcriptional regulator